jgi:hypothetical protein
MFKTVFSKLAVVGFGVALAASAGVAQARDNVNWSIGIGVPGVVVGASNGYYGYSAPAPVYYAPPPTYYVPPRPVYYAPPVVYSPPPPYYYRGRGYYRDHDDYRGHGHRHWRDRD